MENKKLEVTKIEDITNGEVVELPPFGNGTPFVARLKTPSILTLCASGAIPNELLQEATDIYEGKDMQEGHIEQYGKVLNAVAKAVLVEPKYEEVKDYLSGVQLITIYNYSQSGVSALRPFREIKKFFETGDTGKRNKQTTKSDNADKK
jgi:hypothetical protein